MNQSDSFVLGIEGPKRKDLQVIEFREFPQFQDQPPHQLLKSIRNFLAYLPGHITVVWKHDFTAISAIIMRGNSAFFFYQKFSKNKKNFQ
jgi:hypothetical protein